MIHFLVVLQDMLTIGPLAGCIPDHLHQGIWKDVIEDADNDVLSDLKCGMNQRMTNNAQPIRPGRIRSIYSACSPFVAGALSIQTFCLNSATFTRCM